MNEKITGLQVKDLIGVFYREDRKLMVADEFEGATDVDAALSRFIGNYVRLMAHHRPPEPVDDRRWGGGCCMLESSGRCHFGHHEDSRRAFAFNAGGVLGRRDGIYFVQRENEELECLVDMLVGHRSQIIVTTYPDVATLEEKIHDVTSQPLSDDIADLHRQISETRDLLAEINRLKDDINV